MREVYGVEVVPTASPGSSPFGEVAQEGGEELYNQVHLSTLHLHPTSPPASPHLTFHCTNSKLSRFSSVSSIPSAVTSSMIRGSTLLFHLHPHLLPQV